MKAAVFYGKGNISVEANYPIPELKSDEVLVKVQACGVCGTDLHIFSGAKGATECNPPVILGHEFSGIVEQIGDRVTRVAPGQHVTVDPNISCGACDQCRKGNPHFCMDMVATGVNFDGGFAEYCVVLERQLFIIPDDTPFEVAAMCEPVACCLHGIDLCDIDAGDNVMIIGGGTIGMIMLQLAQMSGASKIVLLEPNHKRFELARKLGADLVLDPQTSGIRETLNAHGFSDIRIVIECVGKAASVENAFQYAGKGATVMIFGLTGPEDSVPYKPFEAFKKELTVKTSFVNPNTQGRARDIIASGRLNLIDLISDYVQLDNINDAFLPGIRNGKTVIIT